MEGLFLMTFRTSRQKLHLLTMLFDCRPTYLVTIHTTNARIFLHKSVRFGLIAVIQSASILQCLSCRLLLIILEASNCPLRLPRVFFHFYLFKVFAPGHALCFFHLSRHFFAFLQPCCAVQSQVAMKSIALFHETLDLRG